MSGGSVKTFKTHTKRRWHTIIFDTQVFTSIKEVVMASSSLNLVELAKGYLTREFTDKLSSHLGESSEKTQLGLNAAIPGVLSGLDGAASTPDGAKRLASAVDNSDEGILSNIGSMFGRGSPVGIGSLQSILGAGGLSELIGNIGRTSGLPGKAVSTMLSFVAPVVFGMLKKLKLSRGLDASGLSSLLASQRGNIASAMPETKREYTSETYTPPKAVPRARMTETYSNLERERRKSSFAWILPLVIAGLIGLIWWGFHSTAHAGHDEYGVAERTASEKMNVSQMASLDALKSKYEAVLDVAKAQGVQISSLTGQDGKLNLQGTAPSLDAANKVWDEIKRVNPRMDDIAADIKVQSAQVQPMTSQGQPATSEEKSTTSEQQPATASSEYTQPGNTEQPTAEKGSTAEGVSRAKPTVPESSAQSSSHTYVVKSGDTLASISKHFYGNTGDYMRIFNENRSKLTNPNLLEVGQKLEIPVK
jgi:nucleoid-associated protein YgaU